MLPAPGLAAAPVTPAGWRVDPAGTEIAVSQAVAGFQGPMGSALSPDGAFLLAASSGAARYESADLFDLGAHQRTSYVGYDATKGESAFYGAAWAPDGQTAYVSGGGQNVIHVLHRSGRDLSETGTIAAPAFPAGLALGRPGWRSPRWGDRRCPERYPGYTQAGKVDSTHYDTASMVATIEDLVGMPPMSITDARASRVWGAFVNKPDLRPYEAQQPEVVPFGDPGAPINPASAPMARAAAKWDLKDADAAPEIALNESVWKSVKGRHAKMPRPRHTHIIGSRPNDEDEG